MPSTAACTHLVPPRPARHEVREVHCLEALSHARVQLGRHDGGRGGAVARGLDEVGPAGMGRVGVGWGQGELLRRRWGWVQGEPISQSGVGPSCVHWMKQGQREYTCKARVRVTAREKRMGMGMRFCTAFLHGW